MMMKTFTWDTFTELQPVPGPVLGNTGDGAQWSCPREVHRQREPSDEGSNLKTKE